MFGGLRDSSFEPERGAPVGIRINRRISEGQPQPRLPSNPPPESSSSSSDEDNTPKEEIRIATLKTASFDPPPVHQPLTERTSYVEEPVSATTTLDRREQKMEKERALVRRITNDMQIAHFVTKIEPPPTVGRGAFSTGVYRVRVLRFFEAGLRRALWHFGKAVANHQFMFIILSVLLFCSSLSGVIVHSDKLRVSLPFSFLFGQNDVVTNEFGLQRNTMEFNFSNPAFTAMNTMDQHAFAVLLQTRSSKDSILRKDAVMAYTALKKKLDDYPVNHKEYLETCSVDCEIERDMLDRIIKKSSQVALTYPETFVSMSRDASNLSRVFLGSAIGGVDTDSDGAISRAQALLMSFQLRDGLTTEQRQAWRANFEDQVLHTSASNISILPWSPASFQSTVVNTFKSVHRWLVVSAIFLVAICFFASFGVNAYQSKPMVGLLIGVVILLSCAGGLFVQLFASPATFNPLLWPVFFVVSANALVWLFQLHLGWSRFSFAAVHPTEKMAFILAHDGPGIAAAALVIILTYLVLGLAVGDNTHIRSVFFTLSASVTLLFALTIMLVAVVIYRGGRRESKGVKWYQLFKTGDTHFTAPNLTDFDSTALFNLHDRLLDTRPSLPRSVATYLVAPKIRYPIVFFCTAYLIFAAWGCANTRVELRDEHFLPSHSDGSQFISQHREMFGKSSQFLEIIVDQPVEYYEPAISASIADILESAVTEGYATRSVSWLSEFEKFEKSSVYDVNPDTFVPVVNLVFIVTEPFKRFGADLIFDRFQTQIIKSRMYLELTDKGVNKREVLVKMLLRKASASSIPLSIKAPFTMSLKHDIEAVSNVLLVMGVTMGLLFCFSLVLFGQPVLVLLLVFSSATVIMESIGYSVLWGVPVNVVTFTMILTGNALTCVVAMAFCYSYSVSGKNQMRAVARIQYTFQATLFPVLLACAIPVLTYIPLLLLDTPVVYHIWKVLLINSIACLIHYLFFLPNLMLLFSEHLPSCRYASCQDLCCDMEDDNSIYYFPTAGRAVHPAVEGIYHQASYTYSVPQTIGQAPPNYLAIESGGAQPTTPSYVVDYGTTETAGRSRRQRRNSGSPSSIADTASPHIETRRPRRKFSRDDSIYEAPPSPRVSSQGDSPRRMRSAPPQRPPYFDSAASGPPGQWRPSVHQPQPYPYYPNTGFNRR